MLRDCLQIELFLKSTSLVCMNYLDLDVILSGTQDYQACEQVASLIILLWFVRGLVPRRIYRPSTNSPYSHSVSYLPVLPSVSVSECVWLFQSRDVNSFSYFSVPETPIHDYTSVAHAFRLPRLLSEPLKIAHDNRTLKT